MHSHHHTNIISHLNINCQQKLSLYKGYHYISMPFLVSGLQYLCSNQCLSLQHVRHHDSLLLSVRNVSPSPLFCHWCWQKRIADYQHRHAVGWLTGVSTVLTCGCRDCTSRTLVGPQWHERRYHQQAEAFTEVLRGVRTTTGLQNREGDQVQFSLQDEQQFTSSYTTLPMRHCKKSQSHCSRCNLPLAMDSITDIHTQQDYILYQWRIRMKDEERGK